MTEKIAPDGWHFVRFAYVPMGATFKVGIHGQVEFVKVDEDHAQTKGPGSLHSFALSDPCRLAPGAYRTDFHFEDHDVLAHILNTDYAKAQIGHHLQFMTVDQKWSLYRAIASMAVPIFHQRTTNAEANALRFKNLLEQISQMADQPFTETLEQLPAWIETILRTRPAASFREGVNAATELRVMRGQEKA